LNLRNSIYRPRGKNTTW